MRGVDLVDLTTWKGWRWSGWILLAAPAVAHVVLLAIAVAGRLAYPYDLEWMEGGMLHHADRIEQGQGIYVPPSVDFVPYLYTPLYPGLVAVLGSIFGVSYQLGRAISVTALVGVAVVCAVVVRGSPKALAGAICAFGLFAAGYPFVDGWYDLVRADTLFLLMVTAGLAMAHLTVRTGAGIGGQARTAAAAATLALAFFCKQTGIIYVAAGGLIVLVGNWRRVPVYVGVAGLIGLGGTLLMQRVTDGWFWVYVREVHAAHDWHPPRFWDSFDNIGGHLPVVTWLLQATALLVGATAALHRRLPREARTFLVWLFIAVVSSFAGALAWGTQWAHFNAYMPAMLHRAIAAALAVPAIAACVAQLAEREPPGSIADERRFLAEWVSGGLAVALGLVLGIGDRVPWWAAALAIAAGGAMVIHAVIVGASARRVRWLGEAGAAAAVIALGAQLALAWWDPFRWIPEERDRAAGDRLVARIAEIEGEVWVPSHPWYGGLAGKRMYVHRMGYKDATGAGGPKLPRTWEVRGLEEALREHRFAAIVLDKRDLHTAKELGAIERYYEEDELLPADASPRLVTGAGQGANRPQTIWVPRGLPPGAKVLFDFEAMRDWPSGWEHTGTAWGDGPESQGIGKQKIRRAGGRRWATSLHQDDTKTGVLTTPEFVIDGPRLQMRLGGGVEPELRVELVVDGRVARVATVPGPEPSDRFADLVMDVAELRGKRARLRFVDEATGAWGHLNVDEIWVMGGE